MRTLSTSLVLPPITGPWSSSPHIVHGAV